MAQRPHFYGLDLIRFIAALAVSAFHLGYKPWVNPDDLLYPLLQQHASIQVFNPLCFGWIGVQVFFVISGVVIAHSVQNESLGTYAKRRLLRLAPALWISLLICTPVFVLALQTPAPTAMALAVKTALFFPLGPWTMGQFWTLPVEISFYLAMALLLHKGQVARLQAFAAILAVVCVAYLFSPLANIAHGQVMRVLLLLHGVYFAAGMTMFLAHQSGWSRGRIAVLALCALGAYQQIRQVGQSEALGLNADLRTNIAFALWLALTALLLLSMHFSTPIARALSRRHNGLRLIGLSTYPLYLTHYHVGVVMLLLGQRLHLPPWVGVASALVVAVALSAAIAQWIEPTVRRWLGARIEAWSIRRPSRPVVQTPGA